MSRGSFPPRGCCVFSGLRDRRPALVSFCANKGADARGGTRASLTAGAKRVVFRLQWENVFFPEPCEGCFDCCTSGQEKPWPTFLKDAKTSARIVDLLRIGPEDRVLEIGPGPGASPASSTSGARRVPPHRKGQLLGCPSCRAGTPCPRRAGAQCRRSGLPLGVAGRPVENHQQPAL